MWQITEEPMDTSDCAWRWYYMADCGRWHRFEDDPDNPLPSDFLENYYQKNSKGVFTRSLFDHHCEIDFSAMLQTDIRTGKKRRIHRGYTIEKSCPCFSAAPVFWEMVDPSCPYQLIPLSELNPEYQTVAHYVKTDGLLNKSIVSISRIQNLDLWDIYCRKKKQLMRLLGVKEIQERRLFHGTQTSNVDPICKYNFDLRLCGQNGSVYGKGIYFAIHASRADKYSRAGPKPLQLVAGGTHQDENIKIMFLARVMIGKSTAGYSHLTKPDHGISENTHFSCVDDISHPKIFVIFDPNQIYPEYLIHYK